MYKPIKKDWRKLAKYALTFDQRQGYGKPIEKDSSEETKK